MTEDSSAGVSSEASELLITLQHDINCLSDSDRNARKRGITNLSKRLLGSSIKESVFQEIFVGHVIKPVARLFGDPIEKIRELSITLVDESTEKLTDLYPVLQYAMPSLVARIGGSVVQEGTEEIRLQIMEYLSKVVKRCGGGFHDYVADLVSILGRMLPDQFPDIKRESTNLVKELCRSNGETVRTHCTPLTKHVMGNFSHQHAKVRQLSIEAVEELVLHNNDNKCVDEVLMNLKKLSYDKHHLVRRSIVHAAARWMREHADRERCESQFLTLVFCGLADENDMVREEADQRFTEIGSQYEATAGLAEGKGSVSLVVKNLEAMLNPILEDLSDWKGLMRLRASSLLSHIVRAVGVEVTPFLDRVLPTLFRVCRDDEEGVADEILSAAREIGATCDPDSYLSIVLPELRKVDNSVNVRISCAVVLGECLARAPAGPMEPHLARLVDSLYHPDLCQSESHDLLHEVLNLTRNLIRSGGDVCVNESFRLFSILLQIQAVVDNAELSEEAAAGIDELAEVQMLDRSGIYAKHFAEILNLLMADYKKWEKYTHEMFVFQTLLKNAGQVVGAHMEPVLDIFEECMDLEKDWELKRNILHLFNFILVNHNIEDAFRAHGPRILTKFLIPGMTWRAGKVASVVRLMCAQCLLTFFWARVVDQDTLVAAMEDLLPPLITLMDDDYQNDTRLLTVQASTVLCESVGQRFTYEQLRKLYPELLKRLDDSQDSIRLAVCKSLSAFLRCVKPGEYAAFNTNFEYIAKILLVHGDDPSFNIQEAALSVLKEMVPMAPESIIKEATAVRGRHRTTEHCDALIMQSRSAIAAANM